MIRGPLTQQVAQHYTAWSACCGHPEAEHHPAGQEFCRLCGRTTAAYHVFRPIKLASGGVAGPDGYLDLRAAWLCHQPECVDWRREVLRAIDDLHGFDNHVVATGYFGAGLLQTWGGSKVLLWTPKDHGLPCSPFPPPPAGTKVVLVDDVVTTPEPCCEHEQQRHTETPWGFCWDCATKHEYQPGGTMWRMRRWVESWGGEVVGEVEAASL